MTLYPTLEQVGRINERAGGGGLEAADVGGVEGALARPQAAYGGVEAFPDLWSKAGALLHGLCSTQYFADGNKRTAWLTAVIFLEANGIVLPPVEDIQSEAFVLSVATISDFEVPKAAEWFEVTANQRRAGYATDPRIEYLAVAMAANADGGTVSVEHMHTYTFVAETMPAPMELVVIMRIHWRAADLGGEHDLWFSIDQEGRRVAPLKRHQSWLRRLEEPVRGGHAHHQDGVLPVIVGHRLPISVIKPGSAEIVVALDGDEVGRVPVAFDLMPTF